MARQIESGMRAWGISNALRARKFPRSERISRKDRKDSRMSAGSQAVQVDKDTIRVTYFLGNNHRIVSAAERAETVETQLALYTEALSATYRITHHGEGEQAYLIFREAVHPAAGEALRKAAQRIRELPGSAARTANAAIVAEHLEGWAKLTDNGDDW